MGSTFGNKYVLEHEIGFGGCGGSPLLASHSPRSAHLFPTRFSFVIVAIAYAHFLQELFVLNLSSYATTSHLGTVFHGVHNVAGKAVAIKVEPAPLQPNASTPLKTESRIYKALSGAEGVPWVMWSGRHGAYNVLVLDRCGPDLERVFKMCNRHFTLKTVLMLADQLVRVFKVPCQQRVLDIYSNSFHRSRASSTYIAKTWSIATSNQPTL
jgi:hypothetical protein